MENAPAGLSVSYYGVMFIIPDYVIIALNEILSESLDILTLTCRLFGFRR